MKKIIFAALAVAFLALSAGGASADELWNPHLRGSDEGCAAGALPPKGVYFINDSWFSSMQLYDDKGHGSSEKLDVDVDVPIVLWNPGFKVLHADYAVAVAQPFDYTSVYSTSTPSLGNGHWGAYNTVVIPAILSWSLPNDIHVKAQLGTLVNDAGSSPGHPARNGGAGSGNNFWTIEPGAGISYLHNGWNIGADFKYDHNYKDVATGYLSGDQFTGDYTATKTFKKWTAGVGAYSENQLQFDKINGTKIPDSLRLTYGVGPIVGYDFGPLTINATFNYNIATHDDFGGDFVNFRVIMPL